MANDWIIDVLSDLKAFAQDNGLSELAAQLDETILVAATEMSSLEGQARIITGWEVGDSGQLHRRTAAR